MAFTIVIEAYESESTRTMITQEIEFPGRKIALKRFNELKADPKIISLSMVNRDEVVEYYERV
jgi:hypothetical protein